MDRIAILDCTLRDGAQGAGISFSVEDKLGIIRKLDKLGIAYIEAGNPYSNPKDAELFERLRTLPPTNATICAFGSTRKKGTSPQNDSGCQALLDALTPAVSIFGKSSYMHATEILKASPEENIAMIEDTVRYFKLNGREVIFDAEHFFDGYKENPEYALSTIRAADRAGADWIVLCDTNGGCFPCEIETIVKEVLPSVSVPLGIHCHNDTDCAVANSIAAVCSGVRQVQGCITGIGERCGNANLSSVIAGLQLKLKYHCIPDELISRLVKTARYISETLNIALPSSAPYVGSNAFAHKGGMHVDGVLKNSESFEHIPPELVGNKRRLLISEFAGRSAAATILSEFDSSIDRNSQTSIDFSELVKSLEQKGYQFDYAAASAEILVRKFLGKYTPFFELIHYRIIGEQPESEGETSASALIKVKVGDRTEITAAEGNGPVNALDCALRKALEVFYPSIGNIRLIDYKVRVMQTNTATASAVRVLIETSDGESVWTTVGASTDVIDASWQALRDSIEYKLIKDNAAYRD